MERVEVAVVGAGLGGLGLGLRLRQAGVASFRIYDRQPGVGGTWRANTYPGAASDVPSHLYSLSFAPNPRWTRRYPPQSEMLAYCERVAREGGLAPHLRLGVEVRSARFDAGRRRWQLRLAGGEEVEARMVVAACGQLSIPHVPVLPGLEQFAGATWHSASWNHDFPIEGRRVAVVGSGASAIQIVPELAGVAERLYVLQRTPPWIVPRHDRPYLAAERALFRAAPAVRRAYRWANYWRMESNILAFTPGTPVARAWVALAGWHLRRQVADERLREALTPDYPVGCKRVLLSDDYYPALQRPGVELVTAGIERFVPEGIRTRDGRLLELDAVVFATGFHSQSLVAPMRVEGPDGRTLEERWARGPEAYRGVTVAGMPNLCLLYGPNTNLGHNSIVFMLESQIDYVMGLLEEMRRRGVEAVEPRADVMDEWNRQLQERLRDSVWNAGCTSWYKTDDGRITNNWPGPAIAYWAATRKADLRDYALR